MNRGAFHILRAATPYVNQFREKIFVVKVGGDLLGDPAHRAHLADQLTVLHQLGIRMVVVHGGGPQVDEACRRLGIPIVKVAGRRVTTPEVLDVAKMVFAGSMHLDLLSELRRQGTPCVGLTGIDAGLLEARRRPPVLTRPDGDEAQREVDFGLVGDIDSVDASVLLHLVGGGYVPVIAPLSANDEGEVFNTNADTVAAAVAAAVGAEKLLFLVNVPGVLSDAGDATSLIPYLDLPELEGLVADGTLVGGMRPKARATGDALRGGVSAVHVISGLKPDALLSEVFTNQGSGTMIVAQRDA